MPAAHPHAIIPGQTCKRCQIQSQHQEVILPHENCLYKRPTTQGKAGAARPTEGITLAPLATLECAAASCAT
eukprot:10446246-Heterocapsa_arctica.AAC.1